MSIVNIVQGEQEGIPTVASIPPMQHVASYKPGLVIHLFKATDQSAQECFCFETDLANYSKCIMAQMVIPKYFEGMTQTVRGNFLLRIAHQDPKFIDGIFRDKKFGREGCGYSFVTSAKGMFQFNGFTYHPFILRSLTVCYFACETDSEEDRAWKRSAEIGVAIQSQLHYDHKLDLFITTHAELKAPQ